MDLNFFKIDHRAKALCSLFSAAGPLPRVVVVVTRGLLHVVANQIVGQGTGLEVFGRLRKCTQATF